MISTLPLYKLYKFRDYFISHSSGLSLHILSNWPNDKYIVCSINRDIPVRIPSHPYVWINRSVLCNCGIEAENHFLLKSLAAGENANSKLAMYFTVNTAFVNYLDKFPNLTESLEFLVIKNQTTFEQTWPISLNISKFGEVDFLWNRPVDSLKTSFHPLLWTSSGLRDS